MKIVIVEDETFVRLGMKISIENYSKELIVTGSFASAEEALDYLNNNMVDVLVTDIKLMEMNGLDLVRQTKKIQPHLIVILLSCHEDFCYARKAIDLGVNCYLLKQEISEMELPKVIIEQYRHMCENKNEDIVKSVRTDFNEEQKFGEIYQLGYVVIRGSGEKENTTKDEMDFELLCELFQNSMNDIKIGKCFVHHDSEIICLFSFMDKNQIEKNQEAINSFFNEAAIVVQNYFNRNLFLIVSESYEDLKRTKDIYNIMKEKSSVTFYFEHARLIKYEKHKSCEMGHSFELDTESIFQEEWKKREIGKISDFLEDARRNMEDVSKVKEQIVKYFSIIEWFLQNNCGGIDYSKIFTKEELPNYQNINKFDSKKCLEDFMKTRLEYIVDYVKNRKNSFFQIEQYIKTYYSSELTQSDIANHFHINTAYFCQYFKKNKGITYIQFLNQIRIEEAKRLLLQTSLSAEQIAEKVGIRNENYFVRLFKKVTGMTIGEFRKLNS